MKKATLLISTLITMIAYSQEGRVGINTINPTSTLDINGSISKPIKNITSNYTATEKDYAIISSSTNIAGIEITLPDATTSKNRIYYISNASQVAAMRFSTPLYNSYNSTNQDSIDSKQSVFVHSDGSKWLMEYVDRGPETNDWHTKGNAGTFSASNFLGTTDDVDLIFKRNNIQAGMLQSNNTSYGVSSLSSATNGEHNSAFGNSALLANTTGVANTAMGTEALSSNTIGEYNTGFGYRALTSNIDGYYNVAVGSWALEKNTSGVFNIAIGGSTLTSNTIGEANTAIGSDNMYFNTTGSNNISIGTSSLWLNTIGNNNTAVGYKNLAQATIGNNNSTLGYLAGYNITTGSNNIAIGSNANVPDGTLSNQVRLGDQNITYAGIQVAWSVTSDKRWKTNIEDSNLGLNFIKQLRPVFYIRKNDDIKKTEYGFIAQELQEALINNGVKNSGIVIEDDQKMLSVRYNDLFAPVVKAMQEQQAIIEKLQKRIEVLEKK